MTNTQPAPSLSWEAVCARRLERHHLATPAQDARPAEIVRAMCGAHAQVLSAAELSIGLRMAGVTRAAIRRALWEERSLVKTYGPRGTVHLLPTEDLPLWTGALSAIPAGASTLPEGAQMTPDQTSAVIEAIADALAAAELTADELTVAIVERVGPWAGDPVMPAFQGYWPRWRQAMAAAAHRGALCFGPNRSRTVTYTSPQRWLPDFQPMDSQQAQAELLRRYLHSYGPATPQQYAKWLAAPRRWASELFERLTTELEPVELAGSRAWVLAGDTAMPPAAPENLRLLPYFDAYGVGCHPRELVFPGRAYERALAGGQGGNFPLLLIGGMAAGVWHQRRAGRYIDFTVEPLEPLSAAQRRALDEQVTRVAAFLEGTPRLTIGTVTVGPHA